MLQINQIYNEDCLITMANMPNDFVDLTITSPPYDNLKQYDANDIVPWNESTWRMIIQELYRVTKSGGVVVWIVGDSTIKQSETATSFKQVLHAIDCGFKLHDTMIFEKNSSTFPARRTGKRYTQIFEYMFILSKGTPKTVNLICDKKNKWSGHKDFSGKLKNPVPDYSPRTNIWRFVTSFNGVKHPAPFPEKLVNDHIMSWSESGDLVYDPFMGSGTTAKVALEKGRNFIGSELSEEYCKMANKRIISVYDRKKVSL